MSYATTPTTPFSRLERAPTFLVPIINCLLLTTAGIYAHPTPENKRKAVEVLTAVFGGGSEKVADGLREERAGVVIPVSEN
jgi:hypothetical protein